MANDGKLYIIVTDHLPSGDNGQIDPNEKKEDKKESPLLKFAQHQFFNFVESQAKQALSFTVSNIGNFTGNFEAQRTASVLVELAGRAANIATSAVTAFAAGGGGYTGAIAAGIAVATSVASYTISDVRAEYMRAWEDKKKNYAIENLRKRTGMYSLMDGSRGTEN